MTTAPSNALIERFREYTAQNKVKHKGFFLSARDIGGDGEEVPCFVVTVEKPSFVANLLNLNKKNITAIEKFDAQGLPVVVEYTGKRHFV